MYHDADLHLALFAQPDGWLNGHWWSRLKFREDASAAHIKLQP
jgi:hypothetical protein